MAKIFKMSGYLVQATGSEMKESDIVNAIYSIPWSPYMRHFHIEEAELESDDRGFLNDNDPLWEPNCDLANCEKHFKQDVTKFGAGKIVEDGAFYRHFKGKIVQVIATPEDTEHPGTYYVAYKCMDGGNKGKVWVRPYDMFTSEVDHDKYPDVKQKWRFEKINPEELDRQEE